MKYILLLSAALLTGCVSSKPVYLPDGTMGLNVSCDGGMHNFSDCAAKAGEMCGPKGYKVVDQQGAEIPFAMIQSNNGGTYGQAGRVVTRNMFVKCGK